MKEKEFKQVIVVNKGLEMPVGKLASQVSHASMAFLTRQIRWVATEETDYYSATLKIDKDIYEGWIEGSFTKVVLSVNSEEELYKTIERANKKGLIEGIDYFKIIDKGLTVFNGVPTFTCIGFAPMREDIINKVVGSLPLYREN